MYPLQSAFSLSVVRHYDIGRCDAREPEAPPPPRAPLATLQRYGPFAVPLPCLPSRPWPARALAWTVPAPHTLALQPTPPGMSDSPVFPCFLYADGAPRALSPPPFRPLAWGHARWRSPSCGLYQGHAVLINRAEARMGDEAHSPERTRNAPDGVAVRAAGVIARTLVIVTNTHRVVGKAHTAQLAPPHRGPVPGRLDCRDRFVRDTMLPALTRLNQQPAAEVSLAARGFSRGNVPQAPTRTLHIAAPAALAWTLYPVRCRARHLCQRCFRRRPASQPRLTVGASILPPPRCCYPATPQRANRGPLGRARRHHAAADGR